jgi:hypothetical protein
LGVNEQESTGQPAGLGVSEQESMAQPAGFGESEQESIVHPAAEGLATQGSMAMGSPRSVRPTPVPDFRHPAMRMAETAAAARTRAVGILDPENRMSVLLIPYGVVSVSSVKIRTM